MAHPPLRDDDPGDYLYRRLNPPELPARHRYKAIFMDRPVEEVAA
jgi:hypothetical protein